MSNILAILFFVFYFGNAEYSTDQSSTSVPIDCSVDGLYCVIDGVHDHQYYQCSADFKGFRNCAPGTKCKGEQSEPYTYNPCVEYPLSSSETSQQPSQIPVESSSTPKPVSSETPVTPSVGTSSSIPSPSSGEYNPTECKVDGLFCVIDGIHDYQYYECSADYKGFRQCAPGTKCKGEQNEPYTYNPCVEYPYTSSQIPTQSSSSTKPTSSETPVTPSVGTSSSIPSQPSSEYNPMECKVDGLYCIIDGVHDYQYYECSADYKGFRNCAPGTKCKGEQNEPYTYNPCVEYPYTSSQIPSPSSSGTKPTSSETPVTPSVGTSSSIPSPSSGEYNPMECKVDGLFCVIDGVHDYQYYECSADYKGFRQCAPGTKCKGEQNEPYTYNPCAIDPRQTPGESSTIPTQSSSSTKPTSSETPVTPSVGTSSSIPSPSSGEYNPMECKVDGLYCIIDGVHDYQYYECSADFKGFRQCAPGTKCKGEQNEPYTYNPCVEYPYTSSQIPSQSSSEKPISSETPVTPSVGTSSSIPSPSSGEYNPMECKVDGLYCIIDGVHDYQYYECSEGYKGFRQCAPGTKCKGEQNEPYTYNPCVIDPRQTPVESSESSSTKPTSSETPITPSVAASSSEKPVESSIQSSSTTPVPTDCSVDGFFCVSDGNHDYQYLECSIGYQGFRNCAPGTKCRGEQYNPYTYNPCVADTQSQQSTESSVSNSTSSETPVTPSIGTSSSENSTESSTISSSSVTPVPTDCSVDGFFCVSDGNHDYEYLECSDWFKGFRPCAPGTKCRGEQYNPYTYNPCMPYQQSQNPPTESSSEKPISSETPVTPSVGTSSSIPSPSSSGEYNPTECKVDGLYCIIDGVHDYQYYECSADYKGFRQCAPGTKCKGEQNEPYTYNPCVIDPRQTPGESSTIPTQSSSSGSKPVESSTKPTSSETPVTPSVGTSSSIPSPSSSEYNPMECKVDGFFCIIDGVHDYQYYECSEGYKGFRQCAPGTKCKGEQNESYTYNPCVIDPNAQSQIPSTSSSGSKPTSSEIPVTPSVGTSSSIPSQPSSEYNPLKCQENGFFCIMDGNHDYEYLECSDGYKGFRPCAPGTKCAGEQDEPYKFNPCVIIDPRENPGESSTTPTTPSIGGKSSENPDQSQEDIMSCGEFECPEDGIYCQIDGTRNNRYCECATTFKGSRPCATGTWCNGEQDKPYGYNPCVFIDQTTWFGQEIHQLN